MPSEVRYVTFESDEVRAAVLEHLVKRLNYRIDYDIARIELGQAGDGPIGHIHFRSKLDVPSKMLGTSDFLEAILAYCHSRRIPLPVKGLKSLEIAESNLVLSIRKG